MLRIPPPPPPPLPRPVLSLAPVDCLLSQFTLKTGHALQDPSGTVALFPTELLVNPGVTSTNPIAVSAVSITSGFTGDVPVTATVGNTADLVYDGVTADLVIHVEDNTPPELLIVSSETTLLEGSTVTYQVALATAPSADVTVTPSPSWLSGLPHGTVISPTPLVFPAGESLVYQTVTVSLPYSPEFIGDSVLSIDHVLTSNDPFYDSGSGSGASAAPVSLDVKDLDEVGVCLADCLERTPLEMLFTGKEADAVMTPYEIITGEVHRPTPTAWLSSGISERAREQI